MEDIKNTEIASASEEAANASEKKKGKKTAAVIILTAVILLAAGFLIWWFFIKPVNNDERIPEVRINTPGKIELSEDGFSLPVTLSAMPENELFPALSISITFDNTKLKFLGIDDGNVLVLSDENEQGASLNLPDWSVNTTFANQSGRINIMYLDSTAGRYAFTADGFDSETKNILCKLKFEFRGSAADGDIYDFVIKDACVASSDEEKSLAMTKGTLKAVDGRLIIDG